MLFACPSLYKKSIDPEVLNAHRAWLQKAIEEGVILSAGRRDPAVGGLIILRAADQAAAQHILTADPFAQHGIAEYETLGFNPSFGALQG